MNKTPRRKRAGTIALAAAHTLTARALEMDHETQGVFARNIERWLDNGHNLDAADIEWLAQESKDAVAGQRAARLLVEPELPVLTVTETDAGLWQTFQSDDTGDGSLWLWPTLDHAVRSLRGFLLREYAPRS